MRVNKILATTAVVAILAVPVGVRFLAHKDVFQKPPAQIQPASPPSIRKICGQSQNPFFFYFLESAAYGKISGDTLWMWNYPSRADLAAILTPEQNATLEKMAVQLVRLVPRESLQRLAETDLYNCVMQLDSYLTPAMLASLNEVTNSLTPRQKLLLQNSTSLATTSPKLAATILLGIVVFLVWHGRNAIHILRQGEDELPMQF